MKKLIPLMLGMALAFGAVTTFAHPQDSKTTKATKAKKAKKSTAPKS
jgi:hypothetical protein